jgi:molybdate transport system substrate-binding protein
LNLFPKINILAPLKPLSTLQSPMQKFPLAVIGAGVMGRAHIERILKTPEFALVGVAEPGDVGRQWCAERHIPTFENHAALLAATRPQGVVIATPNATHVAVAANFTDAAKEIAAAFKARTGHKVVLSFGSSGQLLAQIQQGAPYKVFLSADDERPKTLITQGLALAETRFTYAIGKLVLWSKDSAFVKDEATLRAQAFSKIAIANPAAAPYGIAAREVLKSLGLDETLKSKIVMGNSIAQTFQFIDTGNAELGFVSLSQLVGQSGGSRWLVPQAFYSEIRQDAVLLKIAAQDEASRAFLNFLKSPEARAMIEKFGYVSGVS